MVLKFDIYFAEATPILYQAGRAGGEGGVGDSELLSKTKIRLGYPARKGQARVSLSGTRAPVASPT